ncbi:MAG: SpoIIE family protein phosphatase [Mycobacteriales bacterium]
MRSRTGAAPSRRELGRRAVRDRAAALGRATGVGRERALLFALAVVAVVIGVLAVAAGPSVVPPGALVIPLLLGALQLQLQAHRLLLAICAGALGYDWAALGLHDVRAGTLAELALAALICDRLAGTRARLGVPGLRGESMLAELRDRLMRQGDLPELPAGWSAETALRAAGGTSFGGDFLVSHCKATSLELAVVDVSGKGTDAGTRALLLSGALGGLLGAVPPEEFLLAANDYLVRQDWEEGFATAIHLVLDLTSGAFTLDAAGHPPGAQFAAGSGHWALVEPHGPVLGLLADARYDRVSGRLGHGDALLLYTDGVVEVPGRDLSMGIDKLLGEANRLVVRGFAGGAERLLRSVPSGASDDRALLLLWRS